MISKIYKIVNDINDKVYVGKTTNTIEERFKQHIEDSTKRECEHRPLYNAINKYGASHFSIHLIEECDSSIENEREQYWIGYYKGYEEGYNATRGGDGKCLYDYDIIKELLEQKISSKDIAKQIGCCIDVVYKVAKINNIPLKKSVNALSKEMLSNRVKVKQYSLQNEYIQSFDSYADAERWLFEQGIIKKLAGGVRTHIGEVCNGKRKSAYKYIWRKETD